MKRSSLSTLVFLVVGVPAVALAVPVPPGALERVHDPGDVGRGSLLFRTDDGEYLLAPALENHVDIEVTALIARAEVTQTFTNPSDGWRDAVYVFPLPE